MNCVFFILAGSKRTLNEGTGTLDYVPETKSETIMPNSTPETVLEPVVSDESTKKQYTLNDLKALAPDFQQVSANLSSLS